MNYLTLLLAASEEAAGETVSGPTGGTAAETLFETAVETANETVNTATDTITYHDSFAYKITKVNDAINGFVWTNLGLVLLIGAGVILTVATKFFQVSHLKTWWMNTIGGMFSKKSNARKNKESGSVSQFQALCTALAATIGTGNIAGVASAIVVGGPGAVFWMWIAAFFGMMTNFSENILGI